MVRYLKYIFLNFFLRFDSGSWSLTLAARQQLDGVVFMLAARTMKEKGKIFNLIIFFST